ncbi:hypothetical protein L6452_02729 [Arctium lappa]|uniref:Uncharacterized protein n=1 Tax=Arctium lappa TaxID=4217 RepID=A0ACB9FJR2_ARCLA|nr:hypothetical protein L6452_02729 [Arctium lappa]
MVGCRLCRCRRAAREIMGIADVLLVRKWLDFKFSFCCSSVCKFTNGLSLSIHLRGYLQDKEVEDVRLEDVVRKRKPTTVDAAGSGTRLHVTRVSDIERWRTMGGFGIEEIEAPAVVNATNYMCLSDSSNHTIFALLQEVARIKNEHPDDKQCIVNGRVKGVLKSLVHLRMDSSNRSAAATAV